MEASYSPDLRLPQIGLDIEAPCERPRGEWERPVFRAPPLDRLLQSLNVEAFAAQLRATGPGGAD